jgi:hypothetical protein
MTYKKLSPRRLADLPGPRRKKPPIQRQNRALKELVEGEHELLQALIRDAQARRGFWAGSGRAPDPLSVWNDFDQTYLHTETDPRHLKEWGDLSEYMKLQGGFLVALMANGYSFTARLHEDLEAKWTAPGQLTRLIQKRCRRELEAGGLADLAYAYVIERRSRSGKSHTRVHPHGYFVDDDPHSSTRFKVCLERALLRDAQGNIRRRKTDIDIEPAYDVDTGDGRGHGRWVNYVTKNISRWDARLRGRRVFISRPLTQLAREWWELLRTDPFTTSAGS